MKHLQHTSETSEILETYVCNMRFQRNISCCLGMEACRRMDFISVELATPVEKVVAGPVKKATAGPTTTELIITVATLVIPVRITNRW
jgi:hypothetical protein